MEEYGRITIQAMGDGFFRVSSPVSHLAFMVVSSHHAAVQLAQRWSAKHAVAVEIPAGPHDWSPRGKKGIVPDEKGSWV